MWTSKVPQGRTFSSRYDDTQEEVIYSFPDSDKDSRGEVTRRVTEGRNYL